MTLPPVPVIVPLKVVVPLPPKMIFFDPRDIVEPAGLVRLPTVNEAGVIPLISKNVPLERVNAFEGSPVVPLPLMASVPALTVVPPV